MSKGKDAKPHIGIFGRRNNGKSSLINVLAGFNTLIISCFNKYIVFYRQSFIILLTIITLSSCTNNKYNIMQEEIFEYSYDCFSDTSFSFSINKKDTITVYQEFHGYKNNFKAILTKNEKKQINEWLNDINFDIYDSIYANHMVLDGESYSFRIYNTNYSKTILISNFNGIKELKELSDKMLILKRKLLLKSIE